MVNLLLKLGYKTAKINGVVLWNLRRWDHQMISCCNMLKASSGKRTTQQQWNKSMTWSISHQNMVCGIFSFFSKLFGMMVPNDNCSWNESTTNISFWGAGGGRYPFSHLWSGGSTFAGWLWFVLKKRAYKACFPSCRIYMREWVKTLLPYLGNRHPWSLLTDIH